MGEEEMKKKKNKDGEEEKTKKDEVVLEEAVLKVDMHCGACARKVERSLRGFQGVEQVTTDCKASKVVVKGNKLEPAKVSERIQKKMGRKVEIISPLPKFSEPEPLPNKKQEREPPKEEKKDEPPSVITVVLKMSMHCDACAQGLERQIRKIKGVESVKTELAIEQVVVTGVLEPEKLVTDVLRRTRKQASIVVKKEEKKEEEKKEPAEAKSEVDTNIETERTEYSLPTYHMDYSYAPEMFSDDNPNACSIM